MSWLFTKRVFAKVTNNYIYKSSFIKSPLHLKSPLTNSSADLIYYILSYLYDAYKPYICRLFPFFKLGSLEPVFRKSKSLSDYIYYFFSVMWLRIEFAILKPIFLLNIYNLFVNPTSNGVQNRSFDLELWICWPLKNNRPKSWKLVNLSPCSLQRHLNDTQGS